MTALILGSVILGAALGRLCHVLILAPLSLAFACATFLEPHFWPHSSLPKILQYLALAGSLQFGFTLQAWRQCVSAILRRHMIKQTLPGKRTAAARKLPRLSKASASLASNRPSR